MKKKNTNNINRGVERNKKGQNRKIWGEKNQ